MSSSANNGVKADDEQVVPMAEEAAAAAANTTTLVDDIDIDIAAEDEAEVAANDEEADDDDAPGNLPFHQQWPGLVAAFCFNVAIQQVGEDQLIGQYYRLLAVFGVSAFFMALLLQKSLPKRAVRLLMSAGCFCGVTAFFLAATHPLHFTFKLIAWLLYVLIIIASFLPLPWVWAGSRQGSKDNPIQVEENVSTV